MSPDTLAILQHTLRVTLELSAVAFCLWQLAKLFRMLDMFLEGFIIRLFIEKRIRMLERRLALIQKATKLEEEEREIIDGDSDRLRRDVGQRDT